MAKGKYFCVSCKQFNPPGVEKAEGDGTILLKDVKGSTTRRIKSGPWDPNFGEGGIALKSANLIAGVPGAGKSTLVSQIMSALILKTGKEGLLVSAEEEEEQANERTKRLRLKGYDKMRILPVQKRNDVSLEEIIGFYKPCCFVLDSVSMFTPDLEEQVEISKQAKLLAVKLDCIAFVIAHVTKEEGIAGAMKLQHAVDMVSILFNESGLRVYHTEKNRNGRDQIDTFYTMGDYGLEETEDPDAKEDGPSE